MQLIFKIWYMKMQSTIAINFISSKDAKEEHVMQRATI